VTDPTTVRLYDGVIPDTSLTFTGAPDSGGDGMLAYGGNLWIDVDGTPVGSLWFRRDAESGRVVVTLGGWNDDGEWIETEKITTPSRPGGRTIAGTEH